MKLIYTISFILLTFLARAQAPSLMSVENDKPFYFSGQEIRISYYLVNFDNTPVKGDELVYLTLINKKNQSIAYVKDLSKNGAGACTISLPETAESGNYELVVFTHYNRNFGPASFFRKIIPIYNIVDEFTPLITEVKNDKMTFFPEGGHLVNDVSGRVVFEFDHNCNSNSALLMDDRGKNIVTFSLPDSTSFGFGSFYFKPENKRTYKVRHACDSLTQKNYPLPNVTPEAIALSISHKSQSIQIILRTEDRTQRRDSVFIVGFDNEIKVYESNGALNKGVLLTEITKETLPLGTINFFVLNKNREVIANRSILNSSENDELSINIDKLSLATASDVKFKINLSSNVNAKVDVRIVPATWYEQQDNNIVEYLGIRENLNKKFDKTPLNKEDLKLIDNMLIATSAQDNLPIPYKSDKQFIHEKHLFLRGQFTDTKPLPDSTTLYFFIPEINVIYEAKVDTTGFFEFPLLFDFFEIQDIPYYPFSKKHKFENPKIISLEEKLEYTSNKGAKLSWTNVEAEAKNELLAQEKINEIFNFYTQQNNEEILEGVFNISGLIFAPDAEFIMDKYVSFASMEEIIKEILNGVMLRKRKGSYSLHMFSQDEQAVYKESPFIFIDNVPTKDIDELLNVRPEDVERIRIVNSNQKLIQMGPFGDGGLIIIDLKPTAKNYGSRDKKLTFKAAGLSRGSKTMSTSRQSNLPDMRSVLLWNPNQTLNAGTALDVTFTTSDRPGDYIIVAESISEDGKIGYATKKISVSFKGTNQIGKIDQE